MNGVLHSEHVISRSGIAVSLLESEIEDLALYALRSAGVTFLSSTGLWHESAAFKRTPKACVPTGLVVMSVLQWFTFFYVFLRTLTNKSVAKYLHTPASMLHKSHTPIRKTLSFNRYVACSSFDERMNQVCYKGPDT